MATEEPEVGDKVSWQWNASHPSGEVVEKATEGEVSVQSHRGNTIKKTASPDDPAIHIGRSGNDVVKKQSELEVEEKGDGGAAAENGGTNGEAKTGEKREREEDGEAEGEKEEVKKQKVGRGRPKKADKAAATAKAPAKGGEGDDAAEQPKKGRGRPKKSEEEKKQVEKKTNEPKKARGRPKKSEETKTDAPKAAKAPGRPKKEMKAKPATNGTGIGSRTRSNKK